MSVIVKGMEMPTTCCNCKFREPFIDFAYCHLAEMDMEYEESDNCRHPNCPLIELPPHSDLIDRNKLLRRAKKESTYAWKMNLHARTETILNQFIDWLDEAPTVIEAEGERNESETV